MGNANIEGELKNYELEVLETGLMKISGKEWLAKVIVVMFPLLQ